jgi:hypothetical protein
MKIKLNSFHYKLFIIIAVYTTLLIWREFLKGAYLWDESHYWETSLIFSKSLIPSLNELKNYEELNTPLPFIIFGILQYLFRQGIFLGRLLTLILSLIIALIIGRERNN